MGGVGTAAFQSQAAVHRDNVLGEGCQGTRVVWPTTLSCSGISGSEVQSTDHILSPLQYSTVLETEAHMEVCHAGHSKDQQRWGLVSVRP